MTPGTLWLSLGLLGGSTLHDPRLADYQWTVTPRAQFGATARLGAGPFASGLRVSTTSTHQHIGLPDPTSSAAVRSTRIEWIGEARLSRFAGVELLAGASAGRLHLAYRPDRVQVPASGPTPAIDVELRPIDTWIGGAGLGARRPLVGPLSLGVSCERQYFALDTAHRNGNEIVTARETFAEWTARFELAWRSRRA